MFYKKNIKKKQLKLILILSVVFFSVFLFTGGLVKFSNRNNDSDQNNLNIVKITSSDDFNILDFWKKEIGRVNSQPLNIKLGAVNSLKYTNPYTKKEYEFFSQGIYFDSPNWVGAELPTITLHGYILYPEEIKNKNPGCLCMHGLFGKAEKAFDLAYPYLEKGFIVLCHSHPGHGKSEGAKPSPNNFNYEGEYRKTAHYYLTLCGAIQGLRILESFNLVDDSKIIVTGSSYGALNTMWLAGICGQKIVGALPYIAMGDMEKVIEDPTKLFYWILGVNTNDIPESYKNNQNLRFDPKYYLKSNKLPPIFWQFGTNDEFFHYYSINGTYDAVSHGFKSLQIYPNAHHGFPDFQNTTKFFIDYIINGGPSPPKINVKEHLKEFNIFGDTLKIEIDITSNRGIESVQVCYKYINVVGSCWKKLELERTDSNTWTGSLNPGIITSKVDYYIIANLKGEENIWFSSKIYNGGIINSNFTILFFILLATFITLPAIFLIWRRYKKNVLELDAKIQFEARRLIFIELSSLGVSEALFYISLLLPWIAFGNNIVTWSHIYIFNNFFTWDVLFGFFAPLITAMYIIGWILYSHLSIMKPMISGSIKIIYPIFLLSVFNLLIGSSPLSLSFGIVYPGIGIFLMIIASVFTCIVGIWKRKYQARLGIRIPKTKIYNIDRWFRIKNPAKSMNQLDIKNNIEIS